MTNLFNYCLRLVGAGNNILIEYLDDSIDATDTGKFEKGRSLWQDSYLRLKKNKLAVFSIATLSIISLLILFAPYIIYFPFDDTDWSSMLTPPSFASGHYFGTDLLGRDIFARTLYGGRMSLMVGVVATIVSVIIGITYGATAGFLGGRVDSIMMRIVDILYALPFMFFCDFIDSVFWS